MSLCTPLLFCCALAAAADPPADKKDAPDRYAVRLAAAAAIEDSATKAQALLTIAIDAADAGQDDVVKKCMAAFPKSVTLGDNDSGLCNLITRLAAAGHEAEALEAAKALAAPNFRNTALASLAAGPARSNVADFWRACEKGDDAAVETLWATIALNAKDRDGETGLMKAAAHGHVAIVKRLLTAENVEVWEVDKQGRTALMKAAENGQDAVVRAILNKYADKSYPKDQPLNLADGHGQTALMLAAAKGHAGVVRVLLDVRYANPLKGDRVLTIEREEGPAVAAPFETSLVDRERKDDDGKTALDLAEANKHAGVVELLKKAGQ
jgi:ankyrin repeat protein